MSNNTDSLSVLFRNGLVQVWDLNTKVPDKKGSKLRGGGKVAEPKLRWERAIPLDGTSGRSLAMGPEEQIAILSSDTERALVTLTKGDDESESFEVEPTTERVLFSSDSRPLVVHNNGSFALRECISFHQ